MSSTPPQPTQRLANAVIAILIVCSAGALYEGTGCNDIRHSCPIFISFISHIPAYVLGAVAFSEFISWGLLGRLVQRIR